MINQTKEYWRFSFMGEAKSYITVTKFANFVQTSHIFAWDIANCSLNRPIKYCRKWQVLAPDRFFIVYIFIPSYSNQK